MLCQLQLDLAATTRLVPVPAERCRELQAPHQQRLPQAFHVFLWVENQLLGFSADKFREPSSDLPVAAAREGLSVFSLLRAGCRFSDPQIPRVDGGGPSLGSGSRPCSFWPLSQEPSV